MHLKRLSLLILGALTLIVTLTLGPSAFAQGVTTAAMSGTLVDKDGRGVPGALVTATHTPTATSLTALTNNVGRFNFSGIPVGGPYTVSASLDGYTIQSLMGVQTQLGQSAEVELIALPTNEVVQMEKFQVGGRTNDLDSNASGAGSVLSNAQINEAPTVSRSFADLIKTNSFVTIRSGQQLEALGINSRYNTITLDGAKINDSFGLASTGLFSLNNPFSLDAIEQLNVSLTPYDVRQSGIAGAAINVVSKSGTNEVHGSAYFIFTDSNWQGSDVFGTTKGTRQPLKERTYGFTLGGPLIKDKLFFFTNFEKFYQDRAPIIPIFTPTDAFLSGVNAAAAKLPGPPAVGSFGGSSTSRQLDTKRMIKFDWNITQDHRLSVRYSDTVGAQPNTGSLSSNSFSQPASFLATVQPSSFTNGVTGLSSNFYTLNIKEKVWATQLFNNWTPDLKTQFNYSNTQQDSVRGLPTQFPEIRIFNVPGTSNTGTAITNGDAFRFGSEISSMGNELHIKTTTFGGSGDYTFGVFTFTAGVDHESSDYFNLFRQGSYGVFDYQDLAHFQSDTPAGFMRAVVKTGFPTADVSQYRQTGYFAQLKWEPTSRFNATFGLRYDSLSSPIIPPENAQFKSAFGITNSGTIDGTHSIAPRFSFNYALDRERNTQLRGGWGVFLGHNPWVWISNSYGNFGAARFTQIVQDPNGVGVPTLTQYLNGTYSNPDPAFKFDPANPIGTTNASASAATIQSINLIKPGLKLPIVSRGNIAIDHKLPFIDSILTLEYIDTVQLDALFVDNMNLRPTTVAIDGRQLWAGSASSAPIVPGFGNVIRTRNVRAGSSQYISIGLERPMKDGWAYSASYTHGRATEAQALGSSTANSQWQFNAVFNQNAVEVARSDYEIKHRVQLTATKEFRFFRDMLTTVTLAYEGRSGQPYSYVYANDLNNDGFGGNDLVAVPLGASDPRFNFSGMTAAQQAAYLAYIQSSGLARFAGGYAPRNAFIGPWQNRLDMSFIQDIPAYGPFKIELFADFLNFGAWISHHVFNYVHEINASTSNSGQVRQLGAATYGADGRITPTFLSNGTTPILAVDSNGNLAFAASSSQIVPNNADSRWKVQAGVRLKF